MTDDSSEGGGLDDALRRFAARAWGGWLIALVGFGFVSYGLFCLLTFHRRRLQAAS